MLAITTSSANKIAQVFPQQRRASVGGPAGDGRDPSGYTNAPYFRNDARFPAEGTIPTVSDHWDVRPLTVPNAGAGGLGTPKPCKPDSAAESKHRVTTWHVS